MGTDHMTQGIPLALKGWTKKRATKIRVVRRQTIREEDEEESTCKIETKEK